MSEHDPRSLALKALEKYDTSAKTMRSILRESIPESLSLDERGHLYSLSLETIRFLNRIDFLISWGLKRSVRGVKTKLRTILRLAVYESLWLGQSIPTLQKAYLPTGFPTRTVRRAVKIDISRVLQSKTDIERLSLQFSHPSFLIESLIQNLGRDETILLLDENNQPRWYYIRHNPRKCSRAEIIEELSKLDVQFQSEDEYESVFRVSNNIDRIFTSQLFFKGAIVVQDKASILTIDCLSPEPGDRIWDACAAPGGKTQLIYDQMMGNGHLIASDNHRERLLQAHERLASSDYHEIQWLLTDSIKSPVSGVDKILIDAPCSSTGMIQTHPSFKWSLNKKRLFSLMAIQNKLLESVIRNQAISEKTEVVYSTCSFLPHEGESQIDSLMKKYDIELLDIPISHSPGYTGFMCSERVGRLFPHIHKTHGFFIARFRVRH